MYTETKLLEELKSIVKKIRDNKREETISVKYNAQTICIPIREVSYIEKAKRGSRIHISKISTKIIQGSIFETDEHIDEIYVRLHDLLFARPHDSCIINLRYPYIWGRNISTGGSRWKLFLIIQSCFWLMLQMFI